MQNLDPNRLLKYCRNVRARHRRFDLTEQEPDWTGLTRISDCCAACSDSRFTRWLTSCNTRRRRRWRTRPKCGTDLVPSHFLLLLCSLSISPAAAITWPLLNVSNENLARRYVAHPLVLPRAHRRLLCVTGRTRSSKFMRPLLPVSQLILRVLNKKKTRLMFSFRVNCSKPSSWCRRPRNGNCFACARGAVMLPHSPQGGLVYSGAACWEWVGLKVIQGDAKERQLPQIVYTRPVATRGSVPKFCYAQKNLF